MFWRCSKIVLLTLPLILIAGFIVYKIPYESQLAQTFTPFEEKTEKILDKLTLEQKIGQLFIIGFEGKVLNSEIEKLIKGLHPGGILLLGRNIEDKEQLKKLVGSLQEIALEDAGLPLFIAVDQEGGPISRIEWAERTPQSEIENPEQAYLVGQTRGKELLGLGVNLNLAPLLEVSLATDFIFERSFQKNPEKTAELAKALIQGQKQAGILTAIKHFPGYKGISFNPEEKLAAIEKIPEISQFQDTMKSFPEMIMVSNAIYKEFDQDLPFGFSKKGIQFLRSKIEGNYLIISDDLSQNSLLDKFSLKEIVALPVKAGVDILIFSGWRMPVEEGILAFREAVENGEIFEQRINQSVSKIIGLKQKL